ncbi:MAG: hypothetical protein OEO20_08145 [Gemmatimonadota bacterium]|nr:hypothetical protein [Gemmatimonadota bacterium]MDH3478257.1 hypothetical protein [Gemmatimonadota bacterium]MDH3570218.1 hypothetical protein [Gemmatimonadota bacterium]MDH5549806.1 hypothetical protein [Gemmatimonadota bacterium]
MDVSKCTDWSAGHRATGWVIACASLLLVLAMPAEAHGQTRQGFWASGGLGMGFGAARCAVCRGSRDAGLAASLGAGASLGQAFALGVDGNGWSSDEGAVGLSIGTVNALMLWYPSARTPWFFSFGSGVFLYRADDDDPDVPAITAASLGIRAGVGYDVSIADKLAVTPYFNFIASVAADLEAAGESLTGARLTLIQFGVGLTYR